MRAICLGKLWRRFLDHLCLKLSVPYLTIFKDKTHLSCNESEICLNDTFIFYIQFVCRLLQRSFSKTQGFAAFFMKLWFLKSFSLFAALKTNFLLSIGLITFRLLWLCWLFWINYFDNDFCFFKYFDLKKAIDNYFLFTHFLVLQKFDFKTNRRNLGALLLGDDLLVCFLVCINGFTQNS